MVRVSRVEGHQQLCAARRGGPSHPRDRGCAPDAGDVGAAAWPRRRPDRDAWRLGTARWLGRESSSRAISWSRSAATAPCSPHFGAAPARTCRFLAWRAEASARSRPCAGGLEDALARVLSGDWTPRRLPAIAVHPAGGRDEWALNDFVVVRHGAGQLVVSVFADDELYVRLAGDGLIVASPLGSSAYSMAAGGPLLASGMPAPCVHTAGDARRQRPAAGRAGEHERAGRGACQLRRLRHRDRRAALSTGSLDYRLSLHDEKVTLVSFGELGLGIPACASAGSSPTARACWHATSASDLLRRSGECALEVVEGLAPSALVRAHGLFVPEPAVGEANRGAAVRLLELDLDQLPRGVVVP